MFVRVMENLESLLWYSILSFRFPGLENHRFLIGCGSCGKSLKIMFMKEEDEN